LLGVGSTNAFLIEFVFEFADMTDETWGKPIRVRANISVVRTENGGKTRPFAHPFRPNHNFGSPDNVATYIGQIEVPDGGWIHPGETCELEVTFVNAPGLSELLEWGAAGGFRKVGT
jgi:translation elongation factor EF-Tu-like GTPase